MELLILGSNLKEFKNSILSLTKFGEEIDISASKDFFRLSSVNSSRSAFGVITFNSNFFQEYSILNNNNNNQEEEEENLTKSFCVTGKALLSPLKSRTTNSIESLNLILINENSILEENNNQENNNIECRLIIRLHCQHGVIKTHRLTYGKSASLFAKVDRARCTSFWTASSSVLKNWTEHFHLRMNATSGGTEEISFHLESNKLAIKSFSSSYAIEDALVSRPLTTELQVDVEDFDSYQVVDNPVITFALKEFKAIIALAEGSSLTAAFSEGGQPIVMEIRTEEFNADFVIATTDFDSNESGSRDNSIKPERSGSKTLNKGNGSGGGGGEGGQEKKRFVVPMGSTSLSKGKGKESQKEKQPLFRAKSLSVDQEEQGDEEEEEEDEFGMIDFGEEDFAAIDALSQLPPTATNGTSGQINRPNNYIIPDSDDYQMGGEEQEEEEDDESRLGPTQSKRNERWNLSPGS